VKQVYTATDDLTLKKQFSYIIARHVCIALFSLSLLGQFWFLLYLITLVILSMSFCKSGLYPINIDHELSSPEGFSLGD
jgi:hypothetical protein